MNIMIISASMRADSQSLKVANYLKSVLSSKNQNAWICDLHSLKLPLYDDGETVAENEQELKDQLSSADAYVFVSPEWNGMMSHGLVNMFHYVGHEMAHKPAMLVGVSSGRGGTYPIAQMKLVGQKNNHYVIIPENLIVSNVKNMFNDENIDESSADYPLKKRADYALTILIQYAEALKNVRSSDVIDFEQFGNGV